MGEGTQFVVMECIVLEGEDDLTLEPGEVVELVRDMIANAPLLRVRTIWTTTGWRAASLPRMSARRTPSRDSRWRVRQFLWELDLVVQIKVVD